MTEDNRSIESLLARRALAEKATKGDWYMVRLTHPSDHFNVRASFSAANVEQICQCNAPTDANQFNATHIAANSPDVVMADIDEIIRLRREVRRLEDESKDTRSTKALDFACYLLALACQRHHCADCFLRQRRVCPKYANGEPIEIELESVFQADWNRFLRARYE